MSQIRPRATVPDSAEAPMRELLAFCDRVAWLLDDCLRIPGTRFRVGLDAVVGLVPLAGDLLGFSVSALTLWRAARAGVPRALLLKMGRNVAIDFFGSLVPVFGDAFDAVFKAHRRNFELLRREYAPAMPVRASGARAPLLLRLLVAVLLGALAWWAWQRFGG